MSDMPGVGALLRSTLALLRGNAPLAAAAFAAMIAKDVASDLLPHFRTLAGLLGLLVPPFFQYELTLAALGRCGFAVRGHGPRRFWALVLLLIVSGLGIVLGLALLILPGLYLAVRWSVSVPVLIAERVGVIESLKRSGEQTKRRFWPILAVLALTWLLAGFLVVPAELLLGEGKIAQTLVTSAEISMALIFGWHAAVAIYVSGKPNQSLAEIFA
jgi:hypothetical protein